jgi:hypothetical protein
MPVDDETLVAFLDGELDPQRDIEIQRQREVDPELDARIRSLEAGWKLLDQLPALPANPRLAQTTIELIARDLVAHQSGSRSDWYKSVFWAVPVVLGLLSGLTYGWWQNFRADRQTMADLPVMVHFRELEHVKSADWLDELIGVDNLLEAGLPLYKGEDFPELPEGTDQLAAWCNELPARQKQLLVESYKLFRATPPERQAQLRQITEKIQAPMPNLHRQVLKAYRGLIRQISSTELLQIASAGDYQARKLALQKVIDRELAIGYANRLQDEERSGIEAWCDGIKEQNFGYFLNFEDPNTEVLRLLESDTGGAIITATEREKLAACIGAIGQALLERLDSQAQAGVLRLWAFSALQPAPPSTQQSPAELLEKLHGLPSERQNELIYLPASDVVGVLSDL